MYSHEATRRAPDATFKQEQLRLAAARMGARFVQSEAELVSTVSASPLLFQTPRRRVLLTEAQKNRLVIANIASKEEGYKTTAQLVEAFTALVPALINQMISRQIVNKKEKFNYETTRNLVRGIY